MLDSRTKWNIRLALENALYENLSEDITMCEINELKQMVNELIDSYVVDNDIKEN